MSFSERAGLVKGRDVLQLGEMNAELRTSIWNAVYETFVADDYVNMSITGTLNERFYRIVWRDFFKLPLDALPTVLYLARDDLRAKFAALPWNRVYDFVEFLAGMADARGRQTRFASFVNVMLERERSGYRLINGSVAPITDELELATITEALQSTTRAALEGANAHLAAAISLLARRPEPDFRNSVKESISAVESVAKLVAQMSKAELGDALRVIESSIGIHPALKVGFQKLYGYTSDEGGIRHSLQEAPNVDFADAKYMLAACSAFVHYLVLKANKAGLLG